MLNRSQLICRMLILSFFTIVVLLQANAQETRGLRRKLTIPDSTTIQVLKLSSGDQLVGKITAIRDNEIDFQANIGKVTIDIANIEEISETSLASIKNGQYWFPNPNATRLYFAPTARMLERGKGYFQNIYLFFNGFAVGITDNINIGGGMSIFPVDDFFSNNVFYITPKIGVKAHRNVHLAVGALFIFLPFDDEFETDNSNSAGILYSVGTFGSRDNSATAGIGFGFANGSFEKRPFLMLGGDFRLSRRTAFVTENWIIPGAEAGLISYGVRFFGEKISVDLSLLNSTSNGIFPGVPYVDFVVNF